MSRLRLSRLVCTSPTVRAGVLRQCAAETVSAPVLFGTDRNQELALRTAVSCDAALEGSTAKAASHWARADDSMRDQRETNTSEYERAA